MRDIHPVMLEARIFELEQKINHGGTSDYEDLENKPKIENVELVGNLTFEELGIASAEDLGQTNDDLLNVRQVANQNHADIATINSKLGQVPDDENVEDQINEIKDNLNNLIKKDVLSGTTTASGNLSNVKVDDKKIILGVTNNGATAYIIEPYYANGSLLGFNIKNTGSQNVANTSVSITYYYIDIK